MIILHVRLKTLIAQTDQQKAGAKLTPKRSTVKIPGLGSGEGDADGDEALNEAGSTNDATFAGEGLATAAHIATVFCCCIIHVLIAVYAVFGYRGSKYDA